MRNAARPRDVLARIMHLLAEEAPADELGAVAAEVAARPEGAERELLLRAVEHGRRIRGMLERRARGERETQALYETARDLTSLRDVDDVLHAIVDRVRRLLATDSTYIALIDEATGDAYMRVTSGAVTPGIEQVRQRPGWGVGGYVIQTGQPFATSNYLADPRIRRDPSVATAVEEDRIVSIAGVPIRLGQRVVGALFAADRHERTFEQSEIALLTSLADHAAVVGENARLFARVRATTEDLRRAGERLSAQRRALERASAAHEQLMPLALSRADLDEFAGTLAGILDGTVAVEDGDGRALASATAPGGIGQAALRALDPAAPGPGAAVVAVRAGAEAFGRLRFGRVAPLDAADSRTLERAAQTAALLQLMERRTALVEQELRGELVDDLLAERPPDWESFQRRAQRFGVLDPAEPHVVVVLNAVEVPRAHVLRAAAAHAAERGGLAGEHRGHVVLLLPGDDASAAARTAAGLRDAVGAAVTAGAAGPGVGPPALRALHDGAARCHRLLLGLGRVGAAAGLAELGVLGSVLEATGPDRVRGVVDRALGPLLAYDAEHESALLPTVERFFACGRNPPAAARALGVHVNTVYQRLDRIDRVLGGRDWREPQGLWEMQMALQLHRLLDGA